MPYRPAEERCQPYADKKVLDFRTTDRDQDGSFTDSVMDSSLKRNSFSGENTSLQRFQADQCRSSIRLNDTARSPPPQVELPDVSTLRSLSKSPSQPAPHQIDLEKTWCSNSSSCGPTIHNSASVPRLSLSLPHLPSQEISSVFLHHQSNSARGSEASSSSPEHLISQYNIPSQTHISTGATTTPQTERLWQQSNSLPEIPPPPFDITELWDQVRASDYGEMADPSYISSTTSPPGPPPISVSDIRRESITLEEGLNKLSQAPKTLHPIGKPNFAAELPSDEEAQAIATSWKWEERPSAVDLVLSLGANFFPSRKSKDRSPAEPSRQPSNSHKSPENRYVAQEILQAVQVHTPSVTQRGVPKPEAGSSGDSLPKVQSPPHSEISEDKPEHPFPSQLVIARSASELYQDCFAGSGDQKENSDLSQTQSIWFGLSPRQSLSDIPKRYFGEFLHQTPGLSPDRDFFAGFLCVKVGTDPVHAMRDSWARQAKNVLLSHASLRRCNMDESRSDKIAFVRSLKFFGYIINDFEVEMWEMTVAGCRTPKRLKLPTSQSSSRRPESLRIGKLRHPTKMKALSEPAPDPHSENAPRLLSQPPQHIKFPVFQEPETKIAFRSKPGPDQSANSSHPQMFLASYLGTQRLNTGKGVQDFIKFHITLMTWVRNGGYRPYVATLHEQFWYSGSLRDTRTDQGLRFTMSESETIDFLKMARQGMEQEEV